jgi:hypothetical protein
LVFLNICEKVYLFTKDSISIDYCYYTLHNLQSQGLDVVFFMHSDGNARRKYPETATSRRYSITNHMGADEDVAAQWVVRIDDMRLEARRPFCVQGSGRWRGPFVQAAPVRGRESRHVPHAQTAVNPKIGFTAKQSVEGGLYSNPQRIQSIRQNKRKGVPECS